MPAKPSLLPIAQLPAVLNEVLTAIRDLQTAKSQLEQILNHGIKPPEETLKHLFDVYRSTLESVPNLRAQLEDWQPQVSTSQQSKLESLRAGIPVLEERALTVLNVLAQISARAMPKMVVPEQGRSDLAPVSPAPVSSALEVPENVQVLGVWFVDLPDAQPERPAPGFQALGGGNWLAVAYRRDGRWLLSLRFRYFARQGPDLCQWFDSPAPSKDQALRRDVNLIAQTLAAKAGSSAEFLEVNGGSLALRQALERQAPSWARFIDIIW
jgi:hypothetical protein